MTRTVRTLALSTALSAALAATLVVAPATAKPDAKPFPTEIALPDGFQPEGITIGRGPTAWLGSLADGDIYEVSLRTGEGEIVGENKTGNPAVGLKVDKRGRLYVAGGDSGTARVVDSETGALIGDEYDLDGGFVNDVVLTKDAAWFTDSTKPQLYRVDLGKKGEPAQTAVTVPLTGEWVQGDGFNANGISTTVTGKALLVVNSTSGLLYRVDPATGAATEVDVTGIDDGTLTNGDGMLRQGRTLYVVRNQKNLIAVVRLDPRGTSGEVVDTITDPDFKVPTTVAKFGSRLYLPNAQFGAEPTPTEYTITQVRAKPKKK